MHFMVRDHLISHVDGGGLTEQQKPAMVTALGSLYVAFLISSYYKGVAVEEKVGAAAATAVWARNYVKAGCGKLDLSVGFIDKSL